MTGAELIANERARQQIAHGHIAARDDELTDGQLLDKARQALDAGELVKAGALIAAEIDRVGRATAARVPGGDVPATTEAELDAGETAAPAKPAKRGSRRR